MNQVRRARHQLNMYGATYDCGARIAPPMRGPSEFEGVTPVATEQPGLGRTPSAEVLAALVGPAAAGDQTAFARIVAAHHEDMVRVAYVITRDVDAAQDAVQEAWAIAWRELRRLKEPARLRSWLVAIAANEARQILRRQRRRVVTELRVEMTSDSDDITPAWGDRMDLRNALARLSPDDRMLLALRYVAGFESSELSRISGISPSGTRARLQRLLAILRAELQGSNG